MPVTRPSPDPLQYDAVSGAVISSAQWNSNFWKSYNDINAITSALNSCTFSTGTGVSSVVATSPLAASIGSCVPGVGTQLTLSLVSGGTFPSGKFAATNAIDGYNWGGAFSAAGQNLSLGARPATLDGVGCDSLGLNNTTTNDLLMCIDGIGNGAIAGDWTVPGNVNSGGTVNAGVNVNAPGIVQGGTVQARQFGVSYSVPWDLEANPPTNLTHIEHGVISLGTIGGGSCLSNSFTFSTPFSGGNSPFVGLTPIATVGFAPLTAQVSAIPSQTTIPYRVCNVGSSNDTVSLAWYGLGE